MAHTFLTFIACCCMASAVHADEIYRWVDEKGRIQFSDQVPERYRNAATRVDTNPSELTDAQRQEAAARVAREKAMVERASEERAVPLQPAAGAVMGAGSSLTQKKLDCERMQREYRESQECFAPFIIRGRDGRPRRRGAAVREEAFLYCKPVPDPSQQCGAPPQYIGQ
ncbi:hypothetical protein DBR37_10975 [Herminiimonas sp. KBW02]|uniref:DUF4124 domain-containing protein n=1 Tax=Herminiimonas sp. KBW02 TaxID=2153363 RepID=UPI000F5A22D1|nr:DUF4124 domain-containing protein [Herminiimonas sp. KBW02]RQO34887.1 hypothetical protein DBR37_10975 [Herminiimonas sp. KBW02]